MFVFQFSSRRETNREMTRPQFLANLHLLFPEIEALPHADTLYRLLRDIDLTQLEQAHVDLVRRLIRGKSFRRYLINHCHPIAIDGSQKLAGDTLRSASWWWPARGRDARRRRAERCCAGTPSHCSAGPPAARTSSWADTSTCPT